MEQERINFDEWNPNKFEWEQDSWLLATYHSDHFSKWWCKEKYNYKGKGSRVLCEYCSSSFPIWWDPVKFDWKQSQYLARFQSYYFNKWWDSNKYNWRQGSQDLVVYCSEYFNKWWDPDKFEWDQASHLLPKYCKDYFDKWWDKDRFPFMRGSIISLIQNKCPSRWIHEVGIGQVLSILWATPEFVVKMIENYKEINFEIIQVLVKNHELLYKIIESRLDQELLEKIKIYDLLV